MPNKREAGKFLKSVRVKNGESVEGVALRSGWCRTFIWRLETGSRKITSENMVELAMAYGLDPSELVRFEKIVLVDWLVYKKLVAD